MKVSKNRVLISILSLLGIVMAPYFAGVLWMRVSADIFKPDALESAAPIIWGTGLLGLCFAGLFLCVAGILFLFLARGVNHWTAWVKGE